MEIILIVIILLNVVSIFNSQIDPQLQYIVDNFKVPNADDLEVHDFDHLIYKSVYHSGCIRIFGCKYVDFKFIPPKNNLPFAYSYSLDCQWKYKTNFIFRHTGKLHTKFESTFVGFKEFGNKMRFSTDVAMIEKYYGWSLGLNREEWVERGMTLGVFPMKAKALNKIWDEMDKLIFEYQRKKANGELLFLE
jgi:hypothetical protein